MKGASNLLMWIIFGVILVAVFAPTTFQNILGGFKFGGGGVTPTTTVLPVGTCDMTQKGTLQVKAIAEYSGEIASVYGDAWNSDGTPLASSAVVRDLTSISTNVGMNTDVFGYLGSDNWVTGWDNGPEMWTERWTYSYPCVGLKTAPVVSLYNESAVTWTGYEDGTVESSTMLTIGSSGINPAGELKITSGIDACMAHPNYPHQLAVCFGTTNVTVDTMIEYIRPKNYISLVPSPGVYDYRWTIGDTCYELPLQAKENLCDYGEYRFGIVTKANSGQNPEGGTVVTGINATVISYGYYKNDAGNWNMGWEFDSETATDKLIGIEDTGKKISLD